MDRRTLQILLKFFLVLIIIGLIVGYSLYSSKAFVAGPHITVTLPRDGDVLSTSTVSVIGLAKNIKDISFNDRPIFIDEHGNFKETTLLHEGYNVFIVRANDRFGRTTQSLLHLIYTRQ